MQNESKYPILGKMAKKYLAVPATSAPSERIWSLAKNFLTTERSKLSEVASSAYIFIHENISIFREHYEDVMGEPLGTTQLPSTLTHCNIDVGQGNDDF